MYNDDAHLRAHLIETAQRAQKQDRILTTSFLNMAQLDVLFSCRAQLACPFETFGGHERCERKMAAFGYDIEKETFPIRCVHIAPLQKKFAQDLTHRDFLGSILGLGVKRETVGDLFVKDAQCYAFCTDVMAEHITQTLCRVGRTDVHCEITDAMPEDFLPQPKLCRFNVPSPRADALVCAVYSLSRTQCAALFAQKKVFLDARMLSSASKSVTENAVVSVRGYGRFRYLGVEKTTRKDRLFVSVEVY